MEKKIDQTQIAVFGGGCFWCVEAIFARLRGVKSVLPGYAGGSIAHPTYEQVSSGRTGHAEAIKIEYNSKLIKFEDLLNVFFATHDPTTKNRQGDDIGTQYRSAIFYADEKQKLAAEKFMKELEESGTFDAPIVTELKLLDKFYEAEGYHHDYYEQNKDQPYCQMVINPKLAKLRQKFAPLLKPETE